MRRCVRNSWARFMGIAACVLGMVFLADLAAWSCDIAVVSGRVTTDGRPVLWKDRDCSPNWHQQIKYFPAKTVVAGGYLLVFDYDNGIYLNTGSPVNPSGGLNEAGFAISCTSVYEIYNQYHEALNINTMLMHEAVARCATLEDFENMLKSWHLTHVGKTISGNFVAIDAQGGAALYECYSGSTHSLTTVKFKKYDANDGSIVNELGMVLDPGQGESFVGFVNRTNSNSYIPDNAGEERRWRATDLMTELVQGSNLDYYTMMQDVAKDVVGSQENMLNPTDASYSTTYCISRAATRLGLVVHGVAAGDDPRQCVFWCALGEPSIAVFIPFFASARGVSYLAWVDDIGIDGTLYDYNDTCMLNRAFNSREIHDNLLYSSNTGSTVTGMDDRTINKFELVALQLWTFPLEDFIVGATEEYMAYLQLNPDLMTQENLRMFSDYCVDFCYRNYKMASSDAVPWEWVF